MKTELITDNTDLLGCGKGTEPKGFIRDNPCYPWSKTTLGALFDIGAGKSVTPASRGQEPKRPFLRTSNVLWGRFDLADVDTMFFTDNEFAAKNLRTGDLLVCEGGDIGRAAVWQGQLAECSFQNHLHRLRPRRADISPEFYQFALEGGITLFGLIEGVGNRTTIPNLSRSRLAELTVPLPPYDEQRKVAAVLGKVQAAVAVEGDLVRMARELKQAALRQLFTRGLRNEAQKITDLGPVPESWEVVPLGNHLKLAQYGLSVKGQPSGACPILRMNCQLDGKVLFRNLQFVDLEPKLLEAFRLRDGDLVFNRTNSPELFGRTALYRSDREAVFASYLIRLTLDEGVCVPEFVNYFMNIESTQAELKKLATRGVSQANINATKLKGFLIPKPSPAEQREIAALLATLDAKIAHHEARQTLLRELFRTLLHDLLTARRRVTSLDLTDHFVDANKMVPAAP